MDLFLVFEIIPLWIDGWVDGLGSNQYEEGEFMFSIELNKDLLIQDPNLLMFDPIHVTFIQEFDFDTY